VAQGLTGPVRRSNIRMMCLGALNALSRKSSPLSLCQWSSIVTCQQTTILSEVLPPFRAVLRMRYALKPRLTAVTVFPHQPWLIPTG